MSGKQTCEIHCPTRACTDYAPEPLSAEMEAKYSAIIDEILRVSDINTISAKRIRRGLQERVDDDLSAQKVYLGCVEYTRRKTETWNRTASPL